MFQFGLLSLALLLTIPLFSFISRPLSTALLFTTTTIVVIVCVNVNVVSLLSVLSNLAANFTSVVHFQVQCFFHFSAYTLRVVCSSVCLSVCLSFYSVAAETRVAKLQNNTTCAHPTKHEHLSRLKLKLGLKLKLNATTHAHITISPAVPLSMLVHFGDTG